jgi:transcriptional regulator with XRE-family HTH domain
MDDMTYRSFADLFAEAETRPSYDAAGLAISFVVAAVRAMEDEGISRKELGRRVGMRPSQIARLFDGSVDLTLDAIVRIARALGLQIRLDLVQSSNMAAPTVPAESLPLRAHQSPTGSRFDT